MTPIHFTLPRFDVADAAQLLDERIRHTQRILNRLLARRHRGFPRLNVANQPITHHRKDLFMTAAQHQQLAAPPSPLPLASNESLRRLDQQITRTQEIIHRYQSRLKHFCKRLHHLNLERLKADNARRLADPLYQAGLAEMAAAADDDDDVSDDGSCDPSAEERAADDALHAHLDATNGWSDPTQGDGDHLPTLDPDPEFADLIEREAQAELNAALAQDGHSRRTAEEEAMEHLHSDETCDASGDA